MFPPLNIQTQLYVPLSAFLPVKMEEKIYNTCIFIHTHTYMHAHTHVCAHTHALSPAA